ncbi:MAG: hypothetical protein KF690_09770 [Bacteroidetes bacterium]|nr:hypothetical protein [Bacteroidota bacterium]
MELCLIAPEQASLHEWATVLKEQLPQSKLKLDSRLQPRVDSGQQLYEGDALLLCNQLVDMHTRWLLTQISLRPVFAIRRRSDGEWAAEPLGHVLHQDAPIALSDLPQALRHAAQVAFRYTSPVQAPLQLFCLFDEQGHLHYAGPDIPHHSPQNIYQWIHPDNHSAFNTTRFQSQQVQQPQVISLYMKHMAPDYLPMRMELQYLPEEDLYLAACTSTDNSDGTWENLLAAQEKERKRISEELLEELAPLLTAARMNLEGLDLVNQGHEKNHTLLLLDTAINHVRSLSKRIVPPALEDFDLFKAIAMLVNTLTTQRHSPRILYQSFATRGSSSSLLAQTAYRAIQSILQNALQHSQATEITLHIYNPEPHLLRLVVADNGVGFDPGAILSTQSPSNDLSDIATKAHLLGGQFSIESKPGKGSTFVLDIPCSA